MSTEVEIDKSIYNNCPFVLSDCNHIYNFHCICIMNKHWWNGGYISNKMNKNEKQEFSFIVNQSKNIIENLIKKFNEKKILIGPFFNYSNYFDWKDLKRQRLYKYLSKIISDNQYIEFSVSELDNVLCTIIEGNYNYLSRISMYLPKNNTLIFPTHNTELHVFGNFTESDYQLIISVLPDDTWEAKYL